MTMVIVGALVCHGDSVLLVCQHQPELPDLQWALPGGLAGQAESVLDALRREVREETGLEVNEMRALQQDLPGSTKRPLIEALIAYAAFCGLSLLSRVIPPLFFLVIVCGIALPLVWGRVTRDWAAMGFTRQRLGQALAWGLGAGLVGVLYITLSAQKDPFPELTLLGLQLAIGIPLAILILSPFQEFFFRGWLQSRFEVSLGRWIGLLVTALGFALWHLLPPFTGSPTSTLDVTSIESILTTLGMGLLFGYIFQRTRSIVAPWLAHTFWIVALILVGAMTLVQFSP